jgi:hypothetical protein
MLTRQVRAPVPVEPPCVHRDGPGDAGILIGMLFVMLMGGVMGFIWGMDVGYSDAMDQVHPHAEKVKSK